MSREFQGVQCFVQAPPVQQQQQQAQGMRNNARRPKRTPYTWINGQIIAASENGGGLQQLLCTIQMHLPQMNMVNLSTSVHRLAKMTANDQAAQANLRRHPILSELQRSIFAVLTNCSPNEEPQTQSLSNVTWSMATLRLVNRPLVKKVATLATAQIRNFKPYELSTMLWAFAKLSQVDNIGHCAVPFFQAATGFIKKRASEFEFRCLAMIVWAFATMKQRHAGVFQSIAQQMVPKIGSANCQEMANTAWAFGTVDILDERLFNELGNRSVPCLDDFKPQELSNMLWGFASNRCFHESLFVTAALVAKRMDQRNELQAQHLANLLWAFARVHSRHKTTRHVILALLPSCVRQIATFKPQELSSTAQAVAKAFGHGGPFAESDRKKGGSADEQPPPQVLSFFQTALPYAAPNLHCFSEQSLANIVFAFSAVRIGGNDSVIFTAVEQEILSRAQRKRLDPRDMMRLIKGLSAVPREYCSSALGALFGLVACHIDDLHQQDLLVLSRMCASHMGYRHSHDQMSREELRNCCHHLSGMSCAAVGDMAQQYCGNMTWFYFPTAAVTAPAMDMTPTSQNIAQVQLELDGAVEQPETPVYGDKDQALQEQSTSAESDSEKEMEKLIDEEVASEPSCGTEESFGKSATEVRWVYSVKNSFVHVGIEYSSVGGESGDSTDVGDGDDSVDGSLCSVTTAPIMRRSSSTPGLIETQ